MRNKKRQWHILFWLNWQAWEVQFLIYVQPLLGFSLRFAYVFIINRLKLFVIWSMKVLEGRILCAFGYIVIIKSYGRNNHNLSLNSIREFQLQTTWIKINLPRASIRFGSSNDVKINVHLIIGHKIDALVYFRISAVDSVKYYFMFFEKLETIHSKHFWIFGVQYDLTIIEKFFQTFNCFISQNQLLNLVVVFSIFLLVQSQISDHAIEMDNQDLFLCMRLSSIKLDSKSFIFLSWYHTFGRKIEIRVLLYLLSEWIVTIFRWSYLLSRCGFFWYWRFGFHYDFSMLHCRFWYLYSLLWISQSRSSLIWVFIRCCLCWFH